MFKIATIRIHDSLIQLQYSMRSQFLGRVRLRNGLPVTVSDLECNSERQFYRLLLEQKMTSEAAARVTQVFDVGCRNWSYAKALAESFPNANLTGIEVDGWRRYWNLYRRMDYAESFAHALRQQGRNVQFWQGDFREFDFTSNAPSHASSGDTVFCFFFPFVSERPCVRWGLPSSFADFYSLLLTIQKASAITTCQLMANIAFQPRTSALKGKVFCISAHQGEWEAIEARKAYQKAGIAVIEEVVPYQEYQNLWPSSYDTHLFHAEM